MFDKKSWVTPLIYILIALPCMLVCIFMLPPFQGADEDNHFFRAEQIALGNFVGITNQKDSAGGLVDTSSIKVSQLVNHIKFHPEEKISLEEISTLNSIKFSDNLTYTDFKNTVVYAPFFYLPSAAAIAFGKAIDLSVIETILIARLINGLCSLILATCSLYLIHCGKKFLFSILVLPMTLCLFGVISPDGLIISTAAFVVSIFSNLEKNKEFILKALPFCGILISFIITTKIAYIPFLFVLITPLFYSREKRTLITVVITILLSMAIIVTWLFIGVKNIAVPLTPGYPVSAKEQLIYILTNPLFNIELLVSTFITFWKFYLASFVGILGWLDTPLQPFAVYAIYALYIVFSLVSDKRENSHDFLNLSIKYLVFIIIISTFLCIMYSLYLAWSPIKNSIILGVQGRYFIPLALLFSLVLPLYRRKNNNLTRLDLCFYVFPFITIFVLIITLYYRYYPS